MSSTLKLEIACPSETTVNFYQITRCRITEDSFDLVNIRSHDVQIQVNVRIDVGHGKFESS